MHIGIFPFGLSLIFLPLMKLGVPTAHEAWCSLPLMKLGVPTAHNRLKMPPAPIANFKILKTYDQSEVLSRLEILQRTMPLL